MGCIAPHSEQRVTSNREPQLGHAPPVANVSNGVPHRAHFYNSPTGGGVLQAGQANPSRRGNFARLDNARACWKPLQQFIRTKTEIAPSHKSCALSARKINPAPPSRPMTAAAI